MKKGLKIFLLSLGSIALIGGVAGTIYGTSDSVRNWIQDKINNPGEEKPDDSNSSNNNQSSDNNNTSQDEGNNNSNPSTGGDSTNNNTDSNQYDDENCQISLSKDYIYLYDYDVKQATSEEFAATIIGHPSDNRLFWHPLSNEYITMENTVTKSGEMQKVTSKFFQNTQTVRVTMVSNPNIYKDLTVYFENPVSTYSFDYMYACKPSGSNGGSYQISSTSSSAAKGFTYTDNAGTYVHCDNYQRPNSWYPSPAVSLEDGKILEVCASPNSIIKFKVTMNTKKTYNLPRFAETYDIDRDESLIIDNTYTTVRPEITHTYDDFGSGWICYISVKTPTEYVNNDGLLTLCLFGQKYLSLHYNPYVAVSEANISDSNVNL